MDYNPLDSILLPPWLFAVYCIVIFYFFCPSVTFATSNRTKASNKTTTATISQYPVQAQHKTSHQTRPRHSRKHHNGKFKLTQPQDNYRAANYLKVTKCVEKLNIEEIYKLCQIFNVSTKYQGEKKNLVLLKLELQKIFLKDPYQALIAMVQFKT